MSSLLWHSRPVFIYGTLKTGQPNEHVLQTAINSSQAKLLGQATTKDCWPLIVYLPFNAPFLLDHKGTGKHVIGELYYVTAETLATLDRLEGHPEWYTRDVLTVNLNSAPAEDIECETYFIMYSRRDLLSTEPLLAEYRDTPERRFVLPEDLQYVADEINLLKDTTVLHNVCVATP